MAQGSKWAALAIVCLGGVSGGAFLGRSAIAEINPLYFSAPQGTKSYAALGPHQSSDWAEAKPATLRTDDGVGLGTGCIGCRAYPEEYRPDRRGIDPDGSFVDPYAATNPPTRYAVYEPAQPTQADLADAAQREAELRDIERYSTYPVTQEQQTSLAAAEPQPEPTISEASFSE